MKQSTACQGPAALPLLHKRRAGGRRLRHALRSAVLDSAERRGEEERLSELQSALESALSLNRALQAQLAEAQAAVLRSVPENAENAFETRLVLFSGGTGCNSLCSELKSYTTHVAHVLPVSDDGGSTAEIVRVLGGPAVGDIRSRCLRLADDSNAEARAVKALLGYRLPADAAAAKAEWYTIVEGEHALWAGVSEPYKNTVRSFLAHFHFQLVRLASDGDSAFCFAGGSVGNFFFAGARIFFRSLDAAVFLFSRVSGIPPRSAVLPVVSTSGRLVLGAELESGELLRGQSALSHPPASGELSVDKARGSSADAPLPSPVRRVLYLATEETDELHEVFPRVNAEVLSRIGAADAVIYGVGSLWSSICPSLIPAGVGEAVVRSEGAKLLMLNGSRDRETTAMGVLDVIAAVASSLSRQQAREQSPRAARPLSHPLNAYVTHVLAPDGGEFDAPAARPELEARGIQLLMVASQTDAHGRIVFQPRALVSALRSVVVRQRAELAEKAGYVI